MDYMSCDHFAVTTKDFVVYNFYKTKVGTLDVSIFDFSDNTPIGTYSVKKINLLEIGSLLKFSYHVFNGCKELCSNTPVANIKIFY